MTNSGQGSFFQQKETFFQQKGTFFQEQRTFLIEPNKPRLSGSLGRGFGTTTSLRATGVVAQCSILANFVSLRPGTLIRNGCSPEAWSALGHLCTSCAVLLLISLFGPVSPGLSAVPKDCRVG